MAKVQDIKIYSTATCVYCKAEKDFLTEHNVAFQDVRVDADEKAAQEMIEKSGQMGVPFTVITKDDGSEEHILGFDQPRLAAVLGL